MTTYGGPLCNDGKGEFLHPVLKSATVAWLICGVVTLAVQHGNNDEVTVSLLLIY